MPERAPKLRRLWRLNMFASGFFALQVLLLLIVAEPASLPVDGSYLAGPPGVGPYGISDIFDLRIDLIVALFLALAAIDHFAVGTFLRGRYEARIERGQNPFRWYEYSISASVMIVLIAMLAGVSNFIALLAIFGVNAAMILFGLAMERANADRERVDWAPFIYGCIIGAVPWILIALQFVLAEANAESNPGGIPNFVYVIFVTLFVLFNCFAVNMWLSYRRRGRWQDPLFAERVYVWLSITAKTVLAWQVYFGSLAGS